ncbi:MAG: NUDIX hydrolase [Planctomycetes bacterium]|nr:NUDIX hydrolase [Planctomycetota bacterium]
MAPKDGSFRVVASREVFRGRVFRVVNKDLSLSNGRRATWNVIEHPGACSIVARFEDGDVLLLRQLRPATGETLWEIPAGTLEKGESPLDTAKREIVEETGYRARRWKKLREFYTVPGFCNEYMHVFLATDLSPATAERDADEVIRAVRVPFARALRMIDRGEIRDAKTIVGLLALRE